MDGGQKQRRLNRIVANEPKNVPDRKIEPSARRSRRAPVVALNRPAIVVVVVVGDGDGGGRAAGVRASERGGADRAPARAGPRAAGHTTRPRKSGDKKPAGADGGTRASRALSAPSACAKRHCQTFGCALNRSARATGPTTARAEAILRLGGIVAAVAVAVVDRSRRFYFFSFGGGTNLSAHRANLWNRAARRRALSSSSSPSPPPFRRDDTRNRKSPAGSGD
uniref:Uncharacterized protein n=1 Tax=Plectus sambesii TaxID=2011161 RepID=A0A914W0U7_9BILA